MKSEKRVRRSGAVKISGAEYLRIVKTAMSCYWVVPDKFLAGEYPRNFDEESSVGKVDALIHLGVRAFIDLTGPADPLEPYVHLLRPHAALGVSHQSFPIRDLSVPQSPQTTTAILDAIDKHLTLGRLVYVHCWGGVGRTGVIVGCWLARHGYNGQKALDHLHALWRRCDKSAFRRSPETDEQERYVISWEESL
jgi:hypothetical protein